jgi:hypothetical protein
VLPRETASYDEMKTGRLQAAVIRCGRGQIHPGKYAMKMPMALKIVATVALLGMAVWLGTSEHFYKSALLSIFFGVILASVVLIHFRVRPSWRDALYVLGSAAVFAFVDFGVLHFRPSLAGITSYLGISSLSILGLRAIWSAGAEQEQMALAFIPALLFVTSDWGNTILLGWTERWNDKARVAAVVYGLLLTLAWIAMLRFAVKVFWISSILPWSCCVLTVASAIFVQSRLEAATESDKIQEQARVNSVAVAVSQRLARTRNSPFL